MPTHDPVAAARREAKSRTRKGGVTHQQALDEVAREAGHAHWRAMTDHHASRPAPWTTVRAFTEGYMHEGAPLDPALRALLEDALHGYLADAPTDIAAYVDAYELRADGGDHAPDARQRAVLVEAIGAFAHGTPPGAPTLADVERETIELMRRGAGTPGLGISDWVGERMRRAVMRSMTDASPTGPRNGIRPVPLDARTLAQAVDPEGGPWPEAAELTVRCPVHADRNPSLRIAGSGQGVGMACMAGCDVHEVQAKVLDAFAAETLSAMEFVKANAASRVAAGAAAGPEGVGGTGGVYTLEDGTVHRLNPLAARMLPMGMPLWIHDDAAAPMTELEGLVSPSLPHGARYERDRTGDAHVARIVQRDHAVTVRWTPGGPMGLRSCFDDDGAPAYDETWHDVPAAAARMIECANGFETTDPVRLAEIERRHRAEVAYDARHRGTDAEGWGWWVGPDEDEFTWGGPFTTRRYAESEGNGHCGEEGEVFYVVQARTDGEGPDQDGMTTFSETRGLKLCRAT